MSKVYAKIDGFVGYKGRSVPLHAGDEYDASDPMVKAMPHHFTTAVAGTAVVDEERRPRRGNGRQ